MTKQDWIFTTVLVALICGWLYSIFQEQAYLTEHKCVMTGQSSTETLITTQSYDGGKTFVPSTMTILHYEYQCDNGNQWL